VTHRRQPWAQRRLFGLLGAMFLVMIGGGWVSAQSTDYSFCSLAGDCAQTYGGMIVEFLGFLGMIVVVTIMLTRAVHRARQRQQPESEAR